METAVAVKVSAVEVRDRLLGSVEGVAARLPLRRQRENALVYVRGLIEQGGRKSLQRRCFDVPAHLFCRRGIRQHRP
ncbi:MAG TPA: hypothetical protein VN960_00955 [Gaiellaceae bacterium]|nr:hypothetical protein [Gaiellaceae bacterium]